MRTAWPGGERGTDVRDRDVPSPLSRHPNQVSGLRQRLTCWLTMLTFETRCRDLQAQLTLPLTLSLTLILSLTLSLSLTLALTR